jgi:hypothetical protein
MPTKSDLNETYHHENLFQFKKIFIILFTINIIVYVIFAFFKIQHLYMPFKNQLNILVPVLFCAVIFVGLALFLVFVWRFLFKNTIIR